MQTDRKTNKLYKLYKEQTNKQANKQKQQGNKQTINYIHDSIRLENWRNKDEIIFLKTPIRSSVKRG